MRLHLHDVLIILDLELGDWYLGVVSAIREQCIDVDTGSYRLFFDHDATISASCQFAILDHLGPL